MSIVSEAFEIVSALATQDSFTIRTALRADGAWIFGFVATIIGGLITMAVYRAAPLIDRYLEVGIAVTAYLLIALIIFWGVIDRFIFSNQQPWSTTIPPFLFMVMAWFAASYNVRVRTHLSFSEFRTRMGRTGQIFAVCLDAVLWFTLSWILVVTTARQAANSAANFQIVLGTDDTMQWWFIISIPIAFMMLAGRVFQNLSDDLRNYRNGDPIIRQAVIGGDV